MTYRLREVMAAADAAYPPELAESWDSVGLVCGDPDQPVTRVLFAVDATAEVVAEALDWQADLLIVHHPLLLRGVDTVGAHTPKGALLHRMIRAGCALFTAHTNADSADPGVSDALAAAIGLEITGPLKPHPEQPRLGVGRIGVLPAPEPLRAFTARVAAGLPETAWGVRAAGDPERLIRTVAVCGGAGDSLLSAVTRAGVDAYLTADLRHHPADEQLRGGGPALVDAAHWATEYPWCAQAEAILRAALPALVTRVSTLRTDPWTLHYGGESDPNPGAHPR